VDKQFREDQKSPTGDASKIALQLGKHRRVVEISDDELVKDENMRQRD